MKGHKIPYSAKEMAWLEANRLMVISDYHLAFCQKFERDDVSLKNLHSLRKRKGWKTGRTGHFKKGDVPSNKGKQMPFNANRARTQFKPGNRPHNTQHAGHERVSKDGYIEISVEETNPHTGFERRYVLKHRWLWEQENGPIADDMCLKCVGDRLNTDPSNWELIPRAALPRLSGRYGRGYDAAPEELKPIIMTVTMLEHLARTIQGAAE